MSPSVDAYGSIETSLLNYRAQRRRSWFLPVLVTLFLCGTFLLLFRSTDLTGRGSDGGVRGLDREREESIEAEVGVVASDDGRCSEIGASALRRGGHAVDAAVATTLCLGVVNPMSSGIGGGAFMIVRSSATSETVAFDSRETAPLAASQNMYTNNPSSKSKGALSAGVPGELAGLHAAWSKYGRLPWKSLFEPSISLARDGFTVAPILGMRITTNEEAILRDPGLQKVFAPNGKLLVAGDTCYNKELSESLEVFSLEGPSAFYNGSIGEKFVREVKEAGGVITMEDLKGYRVEVTKAMETDVMGFTLLGMPPPSSGTVGMAFILNILGSYGSPDAVKGPLGLHRFVEALKHMFAIRMNIGDPDFVNVTKYISEMLSPSFAEKIRERILDNTTFDPAYYMTKWNQLDDHGTSHFCIVDADRNAVSMTSTINYYFGSGILLPSTGIILNNEMDDFSVPADITPDALPPAPANFIAPGKRPLSSMTPIIVLKDNQLAGVVGGSGGICIIPGVSQVFLNHFILGMDPLAAVQSPRVSHKLIPNEVYYENITAIDGEHIELSKENREFLEERGHQLVSNSGCSVCQLVVHDLQNPVPKKGGKGRRFPGQTTNNVIHGMLVAVSDPRKDGNPAGYDTNKKMHRTDAISGPKMWPAIDYMRYLEDR